MVKLISVSDLKKYTDKREVYIYKGCIYIFVDAFWINMVGLAVFVPWLLIVYIETSVYSSYKEIKRYFS